jgi:lysophospholipase L1-like esterase
MESMRFPVAFLIAVAAYAQPPQMAPQGPPAEPPDVTTLRRGLDRISKQINDYGNLARYAGENATTPPPAAGVDRVVFMGDSITDGWGHGDKFFPGKPYLNRGISGQTTAQMLLRFQDDVIAMKPKAVAILAGTNDIAGNLGPVSMESIQSNLAAMAGMARGNNIKVIFSALLPVCDCKTRATPGRNGQPAAASVINQTTSRPPAKILELNKWMKEYAAKNGILYVDYFTPSVDEKGFLKADITYDGLHPDANGYAIMVPLVEKAISTALGK